MDATDTEDALPAASDVVGPSLHLMPVAVLGRILQNIRGRRYASTLVSLEMVCSSLKSALTSDVLWAQTLDNGRGDPEFLEAPAYEGLPTWREYTLRKSALRKIKLWQKDNRRGNREAKGTDNIFLGTMGGPDGVRNLASSLLHRMNPAVNEAIYQMHLRTDTVSYLSDVLDDYIVTKLTKAFACTTFRSGLDDKDPILLADDIAFLSNLDGIETGKAPFLSFTGRNPNIPTRAPFMRFTTRAGRDIEWTWPAVDHCSDVLSSDESRLLIRRFAYKAGICKIDSRAFEFAISDFLHTMSLLLIDAFEACKGMAPDSIEALEKQEDPRYITSDQAEKEVVPGRSFGASRHASGEISLDIDYYQKLCPPFRFDKNGKIECTIIPRQIQDAASRCGLKPLYGYTSSASGITAFDEQEREEVSDEVMSQYYVEGDGYKSAEDMSIDDEKSYADDESNPMKQTIGKRIFRAYI